MRFFRFRLRTMLVCIAIAAIPLSILVRQIHEARRQRNVVAALQADNFTVHFRDELEKSSDWLDVHYFRRVDWVSCSGTNANDLSMLAELKSLESVNCRGAKVSDLAIAQYRWTPKK